MLLLQVLQREPHQALIWGNTSAGAQVTTLFNGLTLHAAADVNGTWQQRLPPMPASKRAFTLSVSTTASHETKNLHDVLFGDVFLCTGQVRDNSSSHLPRSFHFLGTVWLTCTLRARACASAEQYAILDAGGDERFGRAGARE